MLKTYDPYTKFHGKIDLSKISPKQLQLFETREKKDSIRITRPFVRRKDLRFTNLETGEQEDRVRPLRSYKTILEFSCRVPYCPMPFVLDTYSGYCQFGCIYCFSAYTVTSLMTSFFDSDKPLLAPRYAKPKFVKERLDDILTARGVEPIERLRDKHSREAKFCGAISDDKALKKAAAQRVPLRFGTRNEGFMPLEKSVGASLVALQVLRDHDYPVIINTKADLILEEPYFTIISEMGDKVAIQVSITHNDDAIAKKLEPAAPTSTRRWEVLKAFNDVGINAMARMEPAAAFLNDKDSHLEAYFNNAKEAGCKNFMGDAWHHTVNSEEIRRLFYNIGIDFDRMWFATSEYQILGSYVMEKVMYYAKQHGLRAGTFNFHSLPWNDDPVCCMVGKQFGNWNKYSMIHFLRSFVIEKGRASFSELDDKYFGLEFHPTIRNRIRRIWNLELDSVWRPDWVEGIFPWNYPSEDLEWRFNPERMGEGYNNLIKVFGS